MFKLMLIGLLMMGSVAIAKDEDLPFVPMATPETNRLAAVHADIIAANRKQAAYLYEVGMETLSCVIELEKQGKKVDLMPVNVIKITHGGSGVNLWEKDCAFDEAYYKRAISLQKAYKNMLDGIAGKVRSNNKACNEVRGYERHRTAEEKAVEKNKARKMSEKLMKGPTI